MGKYSGGDTGEGGDRTWTGTVHGFDSDANEVTAAFGRDGTSREGHTMLSDGFKDAASFYGSEGNEGHDHYDGKGGGTDRGQYSGYGS